jgi:hypothetical protein
MRVNLDVLGTFGTPSPGAAHLLAWSLSAPYQHLSRGVGRLILSLRHLLSPLLKISRSWGR